nr:hypothetical protein BN993_00897 [Virgibacillus halodenitrificans]
MLKERAFTVKGIFYYWIFKNYIDNIGRRKHSNCRSPALITYFIANMISASQATSPSTVAIPFPLPMAPLNRMISTSNFS